MAGWRRRVARLGLGLLHPLLPLPLLPLLLLLTLGSDWLHLPKAKRLLHPLLLLLLLLPLLLLLQL